MWAASSGRDISFRRFTPVKKAQIQILTLHLQCLCRTEGVLKTTVISCVVSRCKRVLLSGREGLAQDRDQRLQRRKWKLVQLGAGGGLHVRRPNCPQRLPLDETRSQLVSCVFLSQVEGDFILYFKCWKGNKFGFRSFSFIFTLVIRAVNFSATVFQKSQTCLNQIFTTGW